MAVIAFPTWAYNQVGVNQQPAMIVQTQAALTALGSAWATTPFPVTPTTAPSDPGFAILDTRQQQLLVEVRMQNLLLKEGILPALSSDDLTTMRAEVLALDSGITT